MSGNAKDRRRARRARRGWFGIDRTTVQIAGYGWPLMSSEEINRELVAGIDRVNAESDGTLVVRVTPRGAMVEWDPCKPPR